MWDKVFSPTPDQWGLQGDPYLWQALEERLSQKPPPMSADEARGRLADAFDQLVGVPPNPYLGAKQVRVDAFAHGGMSSGVIDLLTWHDRLLPLLWDRQPISDSPHFIQGDELAWQYR